MSTSSSYELISSPNRSLDLTHVACENEDDCVVVSPFQYRPYPRVTIGGLCEATPNAKGCEGSLYEGRVLELRRGDINYYRVQFTYIAGHVQGRTFQKVQYIEVKNVRPLPMPILDIHKPRIYRVGDLVDVAAKAGHWVGTVKKVKIRPGKEIKYRISYEHHEDETHTHIFLRPHFNWSDGVWTCDYMHENEDGDWVPNQ